MKLFISVFCVAALLAGASVCADAPGVMSFRGSSQIEIPFEIGRAMSSGESVMLAIPLFEAWETALRQCHLPECIAFRNRSLEPDTLSKAFV